MTFDRFDYLEIGQHDDDDSAESGAIRPPGVPFDVPRESVIPQERAPGEKPDIGPRGGRGGPGSARPNRAPQTAATPGNQPVVVTYQPSGETRPHPDRLDIHAAEVLGSRGSGVGQFNFPTGLAVDSNGVLFVADVYNHRVQRITPDGGVAVVGTRGSAKTQFLAPSGVAVDSQRSFYIAELGNHRIQKFSSDGMLELVIGKLGDKAGEFRSPAAICISPITHEILVADTGNGRVQRFTYTGKYIGSLGGIGSTHPALVNPQSIACDQAGNIYVADTLANRIARYDAIGRFTGHFGGVLTDRAAPLAPNVRFHEPHALACNQRGELFVADASAGTGRLVVIASETGIVKLTMDEPGQRLGKFSSPGGIALSPLVRYDHPDGVARADLYISDTMNHRVIRFTCT